MKHIKSSENYGEEKLRTVQFEVRAKGNYYFDDDYPEGY